MSRKESIMAITNNSSTLLPSEYTGIAFHVEFSKDNGKTFERVGKCHDLSPSNDNDTVDRSYTDNTSLSLPTNYTHSLEFVTTKTTVENLGVVVPQNIFQPGDEVIPGVTVGEKGGIQIGEPIEGKEPVIGILRLQPLNPSQKPVYLLNTTVNITDMPTDDNLVEVTCTATAEKILIADLTFGDTSAAKSAQTKNS